MNLSSAPMAINNNRPPALPPLSTLFQGAPATPVTQGMLGVGERDSFSSTYELGRIIGRGSASLVRQARHRVTGQICAVKHINMSSIHYKDRQQLRVEVTILKNARHRNIVSLLDLYETRDELILVMEYALGGELFDRIVAKGKYSEHEASIVMTKLLKAVEYLHNRNIVHRDIKPENILLASPESDTDIKVSDFGIAKILKGHVSTINAPTGVAAGFGLVSDNSNNSSVSRSRTSRHPVAASLRPQTSLREISSLSQNSSLRQPSSFRGSSSLLTSCLRNDPQVRPTRAFSTCGTDCYMYVCIVNFIFFFCFFCTKFRT